MMPCEFRHRKLRRVPVAENIPGERNGPMSAISGRKTSAKTCPEKWGAAGPGRGAQTPLKLPTRLQTNGAGRRSTGTTKRSLSSSGKKKGIKVPPCFILGLPETPRPISTGGPPSSYGISSPAFIGKEGRRRHNMENGTPRLFRKISDETQRGNPLPAPERCSSLGRSSSSGLMP